MGNTAGEVFEKGEKIIQILLKAGFAIKRSKVKGPAQEIQFLGVKWQDGRRQIPSEVINKIIAMSPPTSKKETQAFLGAIGFWRMHIPEYSQIVSPLYLVTRKKNDFHWGPEQQQAFAQIKQEIAHAVARWAHDASGHQGRDATYRWARDRGVDLTMDNISQVIHNCETCAAIKQAKRVKPLWYGGRWLKYRYGEAWQIDYITLPQTRQGKRYVLTMVEATTGWLETYPVPHATARNTILGLEKQVLWRHGTPERIESDNGTHFKNGLINTWAREHGIEWIYHIPYHAPAAGKVERCNGLLKTTLKALGGGTFKNWELNLAKATWMVNTQGSINRAGPAQSEPLHTVDGDKVPVVHMKGILGKTVWINPTSSKGRPIRGIVFAQGPGSTWWAVATEEHPTQKLNWKTDSPVWVEQWLLSKEKLKALQELVDEQLAKGHIVETTSLWNSPVFVIKKTNKGKWRLLHDLRQINNVIEDMGSLQPGMPSPVMLPQNWNLAIIDIKDCFFQIPLHPDDAPRFAFLVPTLDREAPRKRYHWKFLPQGMKHSPSICQWYLSSLLSPVRAAVGEAIILHYMDDVLVCAPNDDLLSHALDLTIDSLVAAGFELQEEKIQRMPPWKYLGQEIGKQTTVPQKLVVKNNIKTLADVQQLCESINWAKHPQPPQPLLIRLVLQSLHQLHYPSLDTLQHLNVFLVVKGPKLNTGFEVYPMCCPQAWCHIDRPVIKEAKILPVTPGLEPVTSLLEKVQHLLNVKDPTSLVFHLVTFLYIVYSFSRMSHTLLNTVGQQIEAREQGDKSVTQAAAKPDSEAKTPAVAAVKKGKKHTDKTDRPVDDDSGEGSSMPPDTQSGVKPPDTQSEAEATDDTQSKAEPTDTKSEAKSTGTRSGVQPTSTRSGAQPAATTSGAQPTAARAGARPTAARAGDTIESFSLKDLRGLRKDYTRRPDDL
ncbi:hypothetical protein DUI87_00837 [Hirundo rustica rustica]|uniref:ribonuclease H n=1 Tax=Hirundo rustica rustica TaxID=333673 RepID=A0A3M0L322_HIRRU|nr:hypothetical protein DUI87_00837 [Hirundo rustica rustica]